MRRNLISEPLSEERQYSRATARARRIMSNALRPSGTAGRSAPGQPERVDRARPASDSPQTGSHGLRGDRPSDPCGLEGIVPPGEARGNRGGVRTARSMGGPLGMALARDGHQPVAIEEQVLARLRMAPGDDHRP